MGLLAQTFQAVAEPAMMVAKFKEAAAALTMVAPGAVGGLGKGRAPTAAATPAGSPLAVGVVAVAATVGPLVAWRIVGHGTVPVVAAVATAAAALASNGAATAAVATNRRASLART